MIISDVQQSDSVVHVSVLSQILFPFRLQHNIKQRSLIISQVFDQASSVYAQVGPGREERVLPFSLTRNFHFTEGGIVPRKGFIALLKAS